jgi:hypothetical protein
MVSALAAGLSPGCVGVPLDNGPYRGDGGYGGYGTYPDDDYEDRVWEQQHRRVSCSEIDARIRADRDKIDRIQPGRHQKARQWYEQDIREAERARQGCRGERRDRWQDHDEGRGSEPKRWRADCDKFRDRIRDDREKMAKIRPGEHKKARQWFEEDIQKAERDLSRCSGR